MVLFISINLIFTNKYTNLATFNKKINKTQLFGFYLLTILFNFVEFIKK